MNIELIELGRVSEETKGSTEPAFDGGVTEQPDAGVTS